MSAKFGDARRQAFLKALRQTGNQTLAAERAKVSRSWVQLHRSTDPEFKRQVKEAVAEAKARLSTAESRRPPSGWGHLDGAELVVKGTAGAGRRRVQIARARLRQITPRVEERFLRTLAATCNVKAAYTEAGVSKGAIYTHRHRWRAFAERWDAAVEEGYVRLELALLENAGNLFSSPEVPPEAPIPPMTAAQAIHLLHMHKHQVRGIGKKPGCQWRPPSTLDEVRPSILRKLSAFERGRHLTDEEKERDRREWGPSTWLRTGPSTPLG